jgi:acetyl esterase/lipase
MYDPDQSTECSTMTTIRKLCAASLPVLLAWPATVGSVVAEGPVQQAMAQAGAEASKPVAAAHLRPTDRLADLLHHPALQGFADRMMPWDGRTYDGAMPLRDIGQLLPYHTHVDAGVVVSAINRLVDDLAAGQTVFYDIYSERQKQADPSRRNTGVFFFRGKPGAPFAVVAPGGGFAYVGSVHEGFPYAAEISALGFNAFVLKYRVGQGARAATEDLAAAVATIFQNARTLQVDTAGYALWGSSAGARMAAALGSHGTAPFVSGPALPRPSAVVMAYTGHSEVTATEPPTFVVVGDDDGIAPPATMQARVDALRRIGTPVGFHRFARLGHGFGTGQGTSAQGWIGQAVRFWVQHLPAPRPAVAR